MGRIAWSMPTYDVRRVGPTEFDPESAQKRPDPQPKLSRVKGGRGPATSRPITEIESCQGGEGTSNEPTRNRNRVVSRGGGEQQRPDP
eukprot:929004-Prorocentrum_minimum.AAC.2